jgi:hypothetical protein
VDGGFDLNMIDQAASNSGMNEYICKFASLSNNAVLYSNLPLNYQRALAAVFHLLFIAMRMFKVLNRVSRIIVVLNIVE